ncbi:DNA polymerase III subunit gamma and tau [Williamsia sp. CHRR-6]|uniref:DNA polymerase III subunit gamma and tau n=1 Tax=Williamsia sp. CHRR-6 TaxID=2835871 RepID=UPI001BD9E696|nr:DNA polymerase III subunit gamma and tau [Williamsia sp. CHRR-6]MBT0567229.1 DNA polymerase III subunit gamma and tau [Williamsia sp. CHRR-6]
MALYRTYRPATFADVVGQEHVTEPLCRALDSGRINHAYLFSGPRGCGKTSSARILARSLNCEQGPTSRPCGTCASCVALAPGGPGNLDVIELDAASHGGVEDTRDLRDKAFYAPAESRYRVFIVDEAHMVSNAGFNALLKIVEEPPAHLIFVFATTEPEKVLPTIRSRTHHYPFRLLAPPVMRGLLEKICTQEQVTVAPTVFPLVIRAGGGSPRDSLSVLDQLLAGAGDQGVTYDRALTLLGVTDVALIDAAVDALAAGDGAALFGAVEQLVDAGHDPRRFAVDLLERFRDLILLQAVPDAADRGLVEAPDDQLDRMRAQVSGLGPATLTRHADTVHAALGEMRGTTSPRLLLEVMCARMLLPSTTDAESAVLQRIERIEAQLAGGVVTAPVVRSAAATASPPAAAVSAPPADTGSRFVRRSQQPPPEPQPATVAEPEVAAQAASAPGPAPAAPPAAVEPEVAEPEVTEPEVSEPGRIEARSEPIAEVEPEPEPEPEAENQSESQPHQQRPEPEPSGPEPAAAVAGVDVAAVRAAWAEVRAAVRERDKIIEVMLAGVTVRDITGDTLTISHEAAPLVARLASDRGATVIADAMAAVFGGTWRVHCVHQANDVAVQPVTGSSGSTNGRTAKPAGQASYTRKGRSPGAGEAPAPGAGDEPPPPEEPSPEPVPPVADEDLTDAERDEMISDAHNNDPDPRQDPEQVALKLLADELGARPID